MATYGSTAGANALVPEWNGSTKPTSVQVTQWLAEGYAKINRAIGNAGYATPIGSSAAVYAELTGLENLYAGAYILRARGIDTASGQEEKDSEIWLRDFYANLKDLAASDLTLQGASLIPTSTPTRRRHIRTLQMRRVDGYSRGVVNDSTTPALGEYTGYTPPSE